MRKTMQLRDQQRVHNAITYVTQNLTQPLTVAEVADKVHLSEFHFHRVFKSITNEPFNQYVRRKRLERAYHVINNAISPSISEVAACCGFSSSANFAKAFKSYFGFSASQHRKGQDNQDSKHGKLFSKYGKEISPSQMYNGTLSEQEINSVKQQVQSIVIQDLPDAHYCCIASTQGYQLEGIKEAWGKMDKWLGNQGIQMKAGSSVGFCWDNKWLTPENVCRYECGYHIESLAWAEERGIAARTRPSGRYLVIEYIGASVNTEKFYLWLLSEYLPSTNHVLVMPFVVERYINVNCEPDIFHFEVQIKIK